MSGGLELYTLSSNRTIPGNYLEQPSALEILAVRRGPMPENAVALPAFRVTKTAVDQIEALGGAVRISIVRGGCCGYVFCFTASDTADVPGALEDSHSRYGCEGAWLYVSRDADELLESALLDYSPRIRPPRFRVLKNPNTQDVFPCKRSFGALWPGAGHEDCVSYLPMPWDADFDPLAKWKKQTGHSQSSEHNE